MIAPLRPGQPQKLAALGGMAAARRALAAVLWRPATRELPRRAVSNRRAWVVAGWAVAVAVAYLLLGRRWHGPWY